MRLVIILLLTGCSWGIPEPTVITETVIAYPKLAEYYPPESIPTTIPELDWPRTKELKVKNSRSCIDIPEESYDDDFWQKCGEYKIDFESNIEIGLDEINLERFNQALIKARGRESQWRALLNTINSQIRIWNEQSTGK